MEQATSDNPSLMKTDAALRQITQKLPGNIRFRALNALEHFGRAIDLIEIDKAMASFRAITGEEEAASALMLAVALRRYVRLMNALAIVRTDATEAAAARTTPRNSALVMCPSLVDPMVRALAFTTTFATPFSLR